MGTAPREYLGPIEYSASYVGSELHRRVLRLAQYTWHSNRRRWSSRFRFFKLLYLVRQPWFLLRALNYLIYLLERGRLARLHYLPPIIVLPPNGTCNLRCPGCPTLHPLKRAPDTNREFFEHCLRSSYRRTIQVTLYRFGEPLLSDQFYEACRSARKKGLWTNVHTNFSLDRKDLARDLVDCGICSLVVSCDGATQDTYARFRRGGNLSLVLANLRALEAEKRRQRTRFPWVTLKFAVFQHNWHEAEQVRKLAFLNGVNEVMYAPGFIEQGCLPGEGYVFDMHKLQWMPVPYIPQRKCKHLWRSLSFDNDGALFPCDIAFREEDVLVLPPRQGNWLAITELWNAAPLVDTRYHFMGRQRRETARGLCARCHSSW